MLNGLHDKWSDDIHHNFVFTTLFVDDIRHCFAVTEE